MEIVSFYKLKKMYVDPSIEGYVFVDYCGLFITKRKANANSKKTGQQRNPYVYSKRGLQTCSGSEDV